MEDLDSLFDAEAGTVEPEMLGITSQRGLQEQLDKLRAESTPRVVKKTINPELVKMRKELEGLITALGGTEQERQEMRRRRNELIERIRNVEAEEEEKREAGKKLKLRREGLPEPMTKGEKERLLKESKRVAKGRQFKEGPQKRKNHPDEDELDGEDRLKLGLNIGKRKKSNVKGKWYSSIQER